MKDRNLCLEISGDMDYGQEAILQVAECGHNLKHPHEHQHFILRHFRDIQIRGRSDCIVNSERGNGFTYKHCHYNQGDQYFRYDLNTFQIHWGPKRNNMCLDVDEAHDVVIASVCDKSNPLQKFVFGTIQMDMLKDWVQSGAKILDEKEVQDLTNQKDSHH